MPTGLLESPLKLSEVLRTLLPVFELLLEGLAFQLLHHPLRSLAFHANVIKGLWLHAGPPNTEVSACIDMVLRVPILPIITVRRHSDKRRSPLVSGNVRQGDGHRVTDPEATVQKAYWRAPLREIRLFGTPGIRQNPAMTPEFQHLEKLPLAERLRSVEDL
jgi:hypothetical protein